MISEGCTIGNGALIAAGAVIPPGTVVPGRELWAGNPAKCVRKVTDDEWNGLMKVGVCVLKIFNGF